MPELNTDPHLLEKAIGAMNLKRTALENSILEFRIRTMPKEMNYLQKTRDIELKKGQQEVDTGALALKLQQDMDQPTREKAFRDYIAAQAKDLSLPAYAQGGYDHLLETAKGLGVEEYARRTLPPPGDIPAMAMADNQTPEKWWDARREKAATTYAERTARITAEAHKTTAERSREKTYEQKTIYGPNGATMNVPIEKGTAYAPPAGWSLNEPPKEGEKSGQNWILPNRSTVISYDGGKTYVTSDGRSKAMPVNAVKVPGGATLEEIRMNEAKQEARTELEEGQDGAGRAPKQAALSGTGPYKRVASAFEAVAGGLGLDILVGQQGFFPDMADAKQYLRSVKQMGKAALMNSSRGPIWEQQRTDELFPDPDKTFTNPRIEARKFGNLRNILTTEKTYNNQAITQAISPKEVEKYRASNNEIDRLMALISEPSTGGITSQEKSLVDKYLKRGK